ncbi:MAG: hypothetical protein U0X76_01360 [Bacteroidia bacterium]
MKKVFASILAVAFTAIVACGPSAEEKAAKEKATQDSIAAATQKAVNDSIAAATQAAAQAAQDSINKAMEAAKADSIAKAEEAAKSKPKPAKKPTHVQVKGPDVRTEQTKKADDKTQQSIDRFKKK